MSVTIYATRKDEVSFICNEDREEFYAYSYLHQFFDTFGFAPARDCLEEILRSAVEPGFCKTTTPANILFRMQKMRALVKSAFLIYNTRSRRSQIVINAPENGMPDMTQLQHYAPSSDENACWQYFPRHLTAAQYHDPYKAIHTFCNYLSEYEWQQSLKEILEYALGEDLLQIDETGLPYNIFIFRLRLLQLIEACWLIDIRSK